MLLSLALRNVLRNFRRLLPMMLSLVAVFALLIMGNAVLNTTIDELYGVFAENVTGDITVSAAGEDNFTVFGADQLLIGQYLVPPTLVNYAELRKTAATLPDVHSTAGLISSAARIELGGQRSEVTVFGVDFGRYFQVVPGLQLDSGRLPPEGEPAVLVQTSRWKEAPELIGTQAVLTAALGNSFTIREAEVRGTFSYPVDDSMLKDVVLVDAATARALNGYLYGGSETTELSADERGALESDFDSMFGGSESTANNETTGVDPMAVLSGKDAAGEESAASDESAEGPAAWNFLLISLHNRGDAQPVMSSLRAAGFSKEAGYVLRDWSTSVGGNAQLARFLQLLFNIGLLFVSFGAVIIAANALLLSILERTGEIGTLRAMGASKTRVAVMISVETLMVVFGSAVIGIAVGGLGILRLNAAEVILENPYIKLLFGGKPIRGALSIRIIISHLGAAAALTLVSMLYPLKRALGIHPVEAMAE